MISVYIREITQAEGYLLGEFKPGELKSLVNLFQTYPTHAIDAEGQPSECKYDAAQFVSRPDEAYFEIIVAGPES